MSDPDVRELFLQAIAHNDSAAMREGIEHLFGLTGDGLSPESEYRLRHEDYVMAMPQSGERIRERDAMRAMQEAFPVPPSITLRRVVGSGRVWVVEGTNNYAGDVWHVVAILELETDGSIIRDTRYYTQKSEAPTWRAEWVESIEVAVRAPLPRSAGGTARGGMTRLAAFSVAGTKRAAVPAG